MEELSPARILCWSLEGIATSGDWQWGPHGVQAARAVLGLEGWALSAGLSSGGGGEQGSPSGGS